MNKAITDGLVLMPAPFSAGLAVWSSGDGTPGSPTYAGAPNAAWVAADQDFGGCLELVKTSNTQRLRYMVQTPYQPGMYLQLTVRLKVLSGALPAARISCLPVNASGGVVAGLPWVTDSVALASYGQVVTLRAIIGSGARQGVNLVWGTAPAAAHVGIDLTGNNGGVVRIDDFVVEDVTGAFLRKMMAWVDVRDYGAAGDGTTNDLAAFTAANAAAAAGGQSVLVSAGTYRLNGNFTFSAPAIFEGTVSMPAANRLSLTRNFDLEGYAAAFGSETEGLKRGLQALFHFSDHVSFDLNGRAVSVTEPIFVAENAGLAGSSFVQRRVLDNGQLVAAPGAAWTPGMVNSQATYNTASPYQLSGVANVANIEVGSLVTGAGVARETYVRSKNVAAGTVELSLPPGSQGGTRTYGFTRFRYLLDFSGFGRLDRFEMTNLEFYCDSAASAIMLPPSGITTRIHGCSFDRPKDRAITSIGTGCQGLMVDECNFLSSEMPVAVQDRTSVGINVNANDVKIRDNRAVRFRHFVVIHGSGHMFVGNHWFQGDSAQPGVRTAGVVMTGINVKTLFTGNYVDNSFIEMTNEREADPNWNNQFSFGGITITGNIFTTIGAMPSFAWIVVTPRGSGHYLQGVSITGNTFRTMNGNIERAEKVDTTWADLTYSRFRNVTVHGNNFNGVNSGCYNPVTVRHDQNSASSAWTVAAGANLAFGGHARVVTGVVAGGPVLQGSTQRYDMPWVQTEQGSSRQNVVLRWPVAVTGTTWVTVRADNPV